MRSIYNVNTIGKILEDSLVSSVSSVPLSFSHILIQDTCIQGGYSMRGEEEKVIRADAHFHLDMLVKHSKQNLKDIVI